MTDPAASVVRSKRTHDDTHAHMGHAGLLALSRFRRGQGCGGISGVAGRKEQAQRLQRQRFVAVVVLVEQPERWQLARVTGRRLCPTPSRSSAPASGGGATALAAASPSAVAAAAVARFTARSSAARIAFHRDEGSCQMLGRHWPECDPAPPGRHHHATGRPATIGAALLQRQAQRVVLRWRLRRRRDARQPWGRVITHILCQQRRTESRTWRHGVRHGERQEHGLGGAFPPPAGRVAETRGGTEGYRRAFGV